MARNFNVGEWSREVEYLCDSVRAEIDRLTERVADLERDVEERDERIEDLERALARAERDLGEAMEVS